MAGGSLDALSMTSAECLPPIVQHSLHNPMEMPASALRGALCGVRSSDRTNHRSGRLVQTARLTHRYCEGRARTAPDTRVEQS